MNKWVQDDDALGGPMEALIAPDDHNHSAPGFKVMVEDDGVELQELDFSAEFVEFMNMGKRSEDGIKLV